MMDSQTTSSERIVHHPSVQKEGNVLVVSSGTALGILLSALCPDASFGRPMANGEIFVFEYRESREEWRFLEDLEDIKTETS